MSDQGRAVIFGRDAESYEQSRPGYPPQAIAHLLGLVRAQNALEIGAGTGKATVDIANPELLLTCLEPSPQMAEILKRKDLPGVRAVVSTFEDWHGVPATFDLIYAAQAWHWVDHSTAYSRALQLLAPGGALALMWNVPRDRYEMLREVYTAHAPELLAEQDARIKRRDSSKWAEELKDAGFAAVDTFTHAWATSMKTAEVRSLYSTYSDHMLLPDAQRERLLDGLADAVDRRGGAIDIEYQTNVFSGQAV